MTSVFSRARVSGPQASCIAFASAAAALASGWVLIAAIPSSAASAKVVGHIVKVGGSKRLQARDTAGGPLHQLKAKDNLTLGETVRMGKGVTATLRVSRPKGVSVSADLIDLVSNSGTIHRVLVSQDAAGTIITITSG